MAIVRWNPIRAIDRFFDDDFDFDLPTLPGISRLAGQGLNLYETDNEIVAEAAVPGIPEDKVDVTVDNGVVRVTGSYEDTQEDKGKKRYYMSSMSSSYNYAFRLPEGAVKDKEPACELDNGVLRIKFEKAQKAAPKRLKILTKSKPKELQ
ncbi:Hsp20/alpha crystallin family protein [Candidatus Daviesbacteria bacterium]|nr:Hsp20/alpha crystallin family protein [Candidatus Daviesbacteria bacterium]